MCLEIQEYFVFTHNHLVGTPNPWPLYVGVRFFYKLGNELRLDDLPRVLQLISRVQEVTASVLTKSSGPYLRLHLSLTKV